ncbi:MAG: hypothetical protein IJS82_05665 [Paludibacteraceae bacterium]|nr:hypothetical protein [Paludibacteraceae bacterium]
MLEDYQINEQLQYEGHYLKVVGTDVQLGGVLGAALMSALLVGTEEGERRGIAISSSAERGAWIATYEREVLREAWGLLSKEVELLSEAYIELATSEMELSDICPNVRILDLAQSVVVEYMCYLTREIFKDHIWEVKPWNGPFASWLLDAARIETRRQRYRKMDWTDAALVTALAELPDETEEPTFFFEGESAADIQKRYLKWVWTSYQAMISELPGAQPRAAKHRTYVANQETDWSFMQEEIDALTEEQRQLWAQWMMDWTKYVNQQLKPEKPVLFWTPEVSEKRQQQLIRFLQVQEKKWDYFKCVSAAIYALRQLGYVRRACSVRDITRWMSEYLTKDYTTKNNRDQFVRAWKELGRYTDEVKHFVELFEQVGVKKIER